MRVATPSCAWLEHRAIEVEEYAYRGGLAVFSGTVTNIDFSYDVLGGLLAECTMVDVESGIEITWNQYSGVLDNDLRFGGCRAPPACHVGQAYIIAPSGTDEGLLLEDPASVAQISALADGTCRANNATGGGE